LRIVSNTSPIVALAHLGELDLLRKILDSAILIPPAVSRELAGRKLPEWFEIRELRQPLSARALEAFLGAGESEALALALEAEADFILLDDKAARRLASQLRLTVVGTLGLLVKAKEAGLIASIRPKLEALRSLPFHISPRLQEDILTQARE
jgi:predicted nucleic acid-binding protein